MTELFSMDEYDTELSQKFKSININGTTLNYKLLEEDENEDIKENDNVNEDPALYYGEESDYVSNLPIPINGKRRLSIIASSYEIDIHETYISSSVKTQGVVYKPKLQDFEPIKVLGRGSFGKVYLVRELATGKLFALKQLNKASLIVNENTNEINQTNYRRTLNEKSILELVNHPNIVKLYYAFQDNNKVYLILEYLDGGELFHHLAQEKFLPEKTASYYVAQMIIALRYLHLNLKVIYRDLKPENCMLDSVGNLVLTDFGLSKVSNDEKNNSITGTVQYMAPEVIKGEPYDYSVDWWSLGCVVYDLLTGSAPFTGNNNKKIIEKILSMKKTLKYPYYLSNDAKDFLRKLLQVNPEKRFDIDNDYEKLKQHRFFRFVDWDKLENLKDHPDILPPIMPIITDPILAENFDKEFTEMQFTPPAHYKDTKDILHINGFSYTNENYLLS